MLLTGFPAGMLACNCYVLAQRQGSDAIVVDPGQRAFAPLRRILDENRLTPAGVLVTHGHIDHIWSAQKVADTFGCPVYIHPADRFMLTDPIRGFGPRIAQIALGTLFREPRHVIELDRVPYAVALLESLYGNTDPYPHGTVNSLYYDSFSLAMYEQCVGGNEFKAKYRVRWYDGGLYQAQIKDKDMYGS